MKRTLQDWLQEAPFTLALSSSFFGYFAHGGVVAALEERGLHPWRATGASAGALVAAALASGLSAAELRRIFSSSRREDFWDPAWGWGYLRGEKMRNTLENYLVPDFARTKIPVEVAVFDLFAWKTEFLSEGSLPQAVVASCAVPGMFHPVRRDSRILFDGGIFRKSGIKHEDRHARTLGIFLESDGLSGWYERASENFSRHPDHRILRFKKIPRVNHLRLHEGPRAFADLHRRMLLALDQEMPADLTDIPAP